MLFFFAAQSPSVAETLHPAFSGVQQYAGTALPSLPPSSLRPTAPGKRFVLSPRITAVYPTTSITPIAQSIPQPPPVLQQQQREEYMVQEELPLGTGSVELSLQVSSSDLPQPLRSDCP